MTVICYMPMHIRLDGVMTGIASGTADRGDNLCSTNGNYVNARSEWS